MCSISMRLFQKMIARSIMMQDQDEIYILCYYVIFILLIVHYKDIIGYMIYFKNDILIKILSNKEKN